MVQKIPRFPTNSLVDAMNDAVASPRSLATFLASAFPIVKGSTDAEMLDRH
jgi:hypothetical protein